MHFRISQGYCNVYDMKSQTIRFLNPRWLLIYRSQLLVWVVHTISQMCNLIGVIGNLNIHMHMRNVCVCVYI